MIYKLEDILLIEILVYMVDVPPLKYILNAKGMTVGEFLDGIDISQLVDDKVYATAMTGNDLRNILLAIRKRPHILEAYIAETNCDEEYGGGGGISALFLNDAECEAVVAFRGTASNEWTDDFLGANQVDSLQQINALEWYKRVYEKYDLKNYSVTVTGHSKGGNKAKYIAILNNTPDRCIAFDGQGFSDKFIEHYRKQIRERQGIIENHNIDYDYVNILMNDVGSRTYYEGFNYGSGGFVEAHSPKTFFNYLGDGDFTLRINPNGQKPQMQILDQFINSMIRSGVSEKEKSETNKLVGMLVEKAFAIGEEHTVSSYISFLCDMIGDEQYSDNTAYLLAFCIRYSRLNPDFFRALKDIMTSFKADHVVKIINMFEDIIGSKKLWALMNVSHFLIMHVNVVLVRQIQSIIRKKSDIELTDDQVRGVLQIICMTKDMLKTLDINMDGSDHEVDDLPSDEDEEIEIPENLNIVVLAGGLSTERNLSLKSGYSLSETLRKKGHNVILLDSFMGYDEREMIINNAFDDTEKYSLAKRKISDELPDLWAVKKRRTDQSNAYFGPNVLQICKQSDIVFIALHGANGENGKVQATFDLLGIDYTGCDHFSSAISSKKSVAKDIIMNAGVPVPKGYCVYRNAEIPDPVEMGIDFPVIVKPNNGGIGLGISVANDSVAYQKALREAFKWDSEILVEEYVAGREFAVGTLCGKSLPVLEVPPLKNRKNQGMSLSGKSIKTCPAAISEDLSKKLREAAETVSEVLGVLAYSKVDFIVRDDDTFICLECDSLPQLYADSDLAIEAEAAGMSYEDLCEKIMRTSLK